MSKPWTDKLPDLFDGYEEAAPEGLWDAVQEEMKPRHRAVPLFWWAGTAAAAAVAAVAVFLWKPAPSKEAPGIVPTITETAVAENTTDDSPAGPDSLERETPLIDLPKAAGPRIAKIDAMPDDIAGTDVLGTAGQPETSVEPEAVTEPEPAVAPDTVTEPAVSKEPVPAADPDPVFRIPLQKEKYRRKAAITFRSGGYLAQGGDIVTSGYGVPSNPGMAYYPTKADGDPITVQMLSRNRESTTTASHRQSIRMFLGVDFNLSPRWSVESGVSYKVLRSTYDTVSGLSSSHVSRNMTYIGIPFNTQFTALERGRFSLYLTAGPMVEACARVRSESRTFVGGAPASEQLDDYPDLTDIRLSLNAGVGAQFRLSSLGALFLQPGVSWQLWGSGSTESFYTVHPWAWDLNLGWRFLF